ncbi:hypothetical protein RFY41_07945, partial [Acinetobacter soli]|uniref:hypothetical protein n=1 Tax=Acinetobacter soli TaxID=487316 RepID=UPI0028130584
AFHSILGTGHFSDRVPKKEVFLGENPPGKDKYQVIENREKYSMSLHIFKRTVLKSTQEANEWKKTVLKQGLKERIEAALTN